MYAILKEWFDYSIIYLHLRRRNNDAELSNLIIDSINCRLIVYEKYNAIHKKTDQKVSVFKIYLKEIKRELSSFDKYYKVILFLIKLILMLKNKLFIIRNVFNIKEIILFKTIMQETIHNCTRNKND